MKLNDLTGKKYGLLTVVSRAQDRKRNRYWNCKCECGTEIVVAGVSLTRNITSHCGCSNPHITHGQSRVGKKTPEYSVWLSIKQRCLNPNYSAANCYSERGITICNRWKDSFELFFEDMGVRPSSKHSIDRINNDGPYSPENCRWATQKEQMRNTRSVRPITLGGETKPLIVWCDELGVDVNLVRARFYNGWSAERAFYEKKWKGGKRTFRPVL